MAAEGHLTRSGANALAFMVNVNGPKSAREREFVLETKETIVFGYKATDKDIKCRDYQFVPGEWHEHKGELSLCENGFHFCEQPSGPWSYYHKKETRIWKVEARGVLETPREPGADFKLVCSKIRLVEEVVVDGYSNTGNSNTGYSNTGNWNATNYSAGYFCQENAAVICFDTDTGMAREEFNKRFGLLASDLGYGLLGDAEIDFSRFAELPGITQEKLASLHAAFIAAREDKKS